MGVTQGHLPPDLSELIRKAGRLNPGGRLQLDDAVVGTIYHHAEAIAQRVVTQGKPKTVWDRKLDGFFTSRVFGFPSMMLLLALIFWVTVAGANIPSRLLADGLFWGQERLTDLLTWLQAPAWVNGFFVEGVYRCLAWVVSVMLPPMAIFFPCFALLEDIGYLPRVAFNLDHFFKKAGTHGKQALTMSMGFGCNTAGVVS